MNPTNDPALRSFVPVPADSHFPIQNLPYGVFQRREESLPRMGVAIGGSVLDLSVVEAAGLFRQLDWDSRGWFSEPTLNAFLAAGPADWRTARAILSQLLRADEPTLRDNASLRAQALVSLTEVAMLLPA